MKMPSPIQRTFKDLEAIQLIKRNVERIDQLREDFLKESEKYKSEDSFLNEAGQEMENLRVEEQALIEEMRQIHSDINALESAKKNAEDVRRHSYQNAKRLLAEMKQLKLDTDDLCKNVQHEALPEQIIDPENEIKFQSSTNPNSHCFSLGAPNPWQLVTGPTFNFTSPILEALQRQKIPPTLSMSEDWAALNDVNGSVSSPTSANRSAPSTSNASFSNKQQPPMKVCTSCQREIHRNAPICPICKAKSKSKHPKKRDRMGKMP